MFFVCRVFFLKPLLPLIPPAWIMGEAKWELGLPWGKGKLGFGPLGMKFLPAEWDMINQQ